MNSCDSQNSKKVARITAFNAYLSLLARMQLDEAWATRIDVSGVVQQTIWEACQISLPEEQTELLSLLRRILANNLKDEIRRQCREKRDVRREYSLENELLKSSRHLDAWVSNVSGTPSQHAIRVEELCRLAAALALLPDDQRRVIEYLHLQELTLGETAERMNRSKEATSALLYRALRRLRQHLNAPGEPR